MSLFTKKRRPRRAPAAPKAGLRGYAHRGGGLIPSHPKLVIRRGTSDTLAEMFPFVAGGGAPQIGVPVGHRLDKRQATMCCDPYSWFIHDLISVPSVFVLGLPHRGKSALIKRWVRGLSAFGLIPQVYGDTKGEYVALIRALGGVVIACGRGRGSINVLDMRDAHDAAARITKAGQPDQARAMLADARTRREINVRTLLIASRGEELNEQELHMLGVALSVLDGRWTRKTVPPLLSDLVKLLRAPTQRLRDAAQDRGDDDRYWAAVDKLLVTLAVLTEPTGLGEVFNAQSTQRPPRDRPVVFDLSGVNRADRALRSALQMVTWSIGFGNIAISHALSDAGLEEFRRYFTVQDEIWLALETPGMADVHDQLSRLDRAEGLVQAKASHTMADLDRILDPIARQKAAGLVERSGLIVAAALPPSEHARLRTVTPFTDGELNQITSWAQPQSWHAQTARTERNGDTDVVGRGNFMAKTPGLPGLPFHVDLTASERVLSHTNQRWQERTDSAAVAAAVTEGAVA